MNGDEHPDISRIIDVRHVSAAGEDFDIAFAPEAIAVLKTRLELLDLGPVRATGRIWPSDEGGFVKFRLTAHVVQACVVSLKPVGSDIDEQVSLHYTAAAGAADQCQIVDIGDEEDPPEQLRDGRLDIGAAMAEHLALALDPWPRLPEAELRAAGAGPEAEIESPFAVLAQLKTDN